MHEALQYRKNDDGTVTCSLCNHRCTIKDKKHGVCGVRWNEKGTLNASECLWGKSLFTWRRGWSP